MRYFNHLKKFFTLSETEEGFIKLYMRKSSPDLENAEMESSEPNPNIPMFHNLQHLMQVRIIHWGRISFF